MAMWLNTKKLPLFNQKHTISLAVTLSSLSSNLSFYLTLIWHSSYPSHDLFPHNLQELKLGAPGSVIWSAFLPLIANESGQKKLLIRPNYAFLTFLVVK
ncbi:hypothetical protein G9A89_005341 [Geosiphon pyriformis]|nr:hypothetical protein G9A89_005341 [Geosiphon pyriformis]